MNAATKSSLALLVFAATAGSAVCKEQRSIKEFSFLIGKWHCAITESGKPDTSTDVAFDWMYEGKTLHEHIVAKDWTGEFFTTYDKRSDTFKGAAVDSGGGYILWENFGLANGRSSEIGYVMQAGALVPVSRSEFERISADHYVFHDFGRDKADGQKGEPTDTEDCTRVAASR